MENWLDRTELLLGKEQLLKLKNSNILIAGLGGVGAYAAEQLCRSGIGELTIIDADIVEVTNKNRQLIALDSTIGLSKVNVMSARLKDINPDIKLNIINEYVRDTRITELLKAHKYDYVVDAIDTLSPKIFLIYNSVENNLPIVSSMGSGGKLDPSQILVSDISKSYNCPLARVLRKGLHRMGIYKGVKVVFSSEKINPSAVILVESENKKSNVGTISYIPAIFGCFMASVVIRDILDKI